MILKENSESRQHGPDAVRDAIQAMVRDMAERHADTRNLLVLGIANGGISFGRRLTTCLAAALQREIPYGRINVMFHRDDIGARPIPAEKPGTDVPGDVDGAVVILADDVLFSGRTVRAAINELFDSGRPDKVELAVLFDRGHRKLPIAADFVGFREQTALSDTVQVVMDTERPERDCIQIFRA